MNRVPQSTTSIGEDAETKLLKRRVLADDKLLKRLTKNFLQWTHSTTTPSEHTASMPLDIAPSPLLSLPSQDDINTYQKEEQQHQQTSHVIRHIQKDSPSFAIVSQLETLLLDLQQCEHVLLRAPRICKVNQDRCAHFVELQTQREGLYLDAKQEIQKFLRARETERRHRSFKEEYDTLTRIVNQFPSRAETQSRIQMLKDDISHLEGNLLSLTQVFEQRRSHVHLLMYSLQNLSASLACEPDLSTSTSVEFPASLPLPRLLNVMSKHMLATEDKRERDGEDGEVVEDDIFIHVSKRPRQIAGDPIIT